MIFKLLKIFAKIFVLFIRKQESFLQEYSRFVRFKKDQTIKKLELLQIDFSKFNDTELESGKLKSRTSAFRACLLLGKTFILLAESANIILLTQLRKLTRFSCILSLNLAYILIRLLEAFRIKRPPGSNLLTIADFLFHKETVDSVFMQIVCDWRAEYFEVLAEKRNIKARWVSTRWRYSFYVAMFKQSPVGELIDVVLKVVK